MKLSRHFRNYKNVKRSDYTDNIHDIPSKTIANINIISTIISIIIIILITISSSSSSSSTVEVTHRHAKFVRIPLEGTKLVNYREISDFRSSETCAHECLQRRASLTYHTCQAFRFDRHSGTCIIYMLTKHRQSPDSYALSFVVLDRFHDLSINGRVYSILASSAEMTYHETRAYCNRLGGFLLEFDSLDKYDALRTIIFQRVAPDYYFVGANDMAEEGQWITDRDNTPLNNNTWIWGEGERGHGKSKEDAAAMSSKTMLLVDVHIAIPPRQVLCERELL